MDKRLKAFVFAAAAHWLLCVMAIVARSRKRKRVERREGITYAPIYELMHRASIWHATVYNVSMDMD